MFITLLVATFVISVVISTLVALLFARPIRRIMARIVPDAISQAWVRYLLFAVYVVGIVGGVSLRRLERYIAPGGEDGVLELTGERWVVEIYSAVVGSLGAITWMLLVFFVFALVAYVVVRAFELKSGKNGESPSLEPTAPSA